MKHFLLYLFCLFVLSSFYLFFTSSLIWICVFICFFKLISRGMIFFKLSLRKIDIFLSIFIRKVAKNKTSDRLPYNPNISTLPCSPARVSTDVVFTKLRSTLDFALWYYFPRIVWTQFWDQNMHQILWNLLYLNLNQFSCPTFNKIMTTQSLDLLIVWNIVLEKWRQ